MPSPATANPLELLTLGAAALNQLPMDWPGNTRRILQALAAAREQGVQVLCLPELCISGHGCEDAFHSEALAMRAWECLMQILPHTGGLVAALGLPLIQRGSLYNCAALLVDGQLAGVNAKRVLAGSGVYYEPRWFQAWPAGRQDVLAWGGREVPFGDLLYEIGGLRIGFEICEEAWAGGPGQAAEAYAWLDVQLNPSASHFAFGKHAVLRGIVQEASRRARAIYVYSNLLGNESGRLIFDGTLLIASNGRLLAQQPQRFPFTEVQLCTASIPLNENRLEQRRTNYPRRAQQGHCAPPFVTLAGAFLQRSAPRPPAGRASALAGERPAAAGIPPAVLDSRAAPQVRPTAAGIQPIPLAGAEAPAFPALGREEAFLRAVALGLWDYLRKSGAKGFAVSLSGGVDSACVAVLCAAAVRLAFQELGWEGLRARLGLPPAPPPQQALGGGALPPPGSPAAEAREAALRALTGELLLTVYQACANSSEHTRQAARGLAESLGSRHLELDLQPLVDRYESLAASALGRPLSWAQDDVARQNIQARVRSPGIWLLANVEGRLLLSTSNRSEAGVGYATMDGDTSGGLAPIAGANKTFLRHWLCWLERQGACGMGPLPALAAINAQPPTAELRPADQQQQDEDDLMPYPVLDAIEQAAIRDRLSPLQVWRRLLRVPPGQPLPPQQAAGYVRRFFQLWARSQWKRERLAPSFHLDDENLDPKTWCRFPILQAGYASELDELQQHAAAASLQALGTVSEAAG